MRKGFSVTLSEQGVAPSVTETLEGLIMDETDVLMQCNYCGNKSRLTIRVKYVQDIEGDDGDHFVTTWQILECRACSTLNLGRNYIEPPYEEQRETIVYPIPRLAPKQKKRLRSIPLRISQAYDTALKVKDEPNAFAVLIGRTLETVCKHEKAEGKTLAEKLTKLADTNRIPPTLAKMAHQLRVLRNLGAHSDDDEVQDTDVPVIMEFVDAILEYLYIAPDKIKKLQDRLDSKSEGLYW